MDSTGKLAPGIVGITVCMILVVAVALPVIGAMIGLVDRGELGPGEVTESGANAFDASSPTYNYVAPPASVSAGYVWNIKKAASGWTVSYSGSGGAGEPSPVDSYMMVVSASTARDSGHLLASSDTITLFVNGEAAYVYTFNTNDSVNLWFTYSPQDSSYALATEFVIIEDGHAHVYPFRFVDVAFLFAQHVDGMPAATHGYVSGAPSAVIGDGIADSKAFKLDVATGNSKMAIDMTDAVGLDQRVFLLDNGMMLDMDDREEPVKAVPRADIGGPVLKTSRAASYTAIMVQQSGVTDLGAASDVTSQYAVSWGEYQAPHDLEAPLLESVSKGGSPLTGWYVPIGWAYTGQGTVLKESTIYTVVSILPAILVVALFILVARWAMAEKGDAETGAFLGRDRPSRHYDGWRDRR